MADEIIKVLDDLAQRMGVVIDWSSENVLPYVTELGGKIVRYELWTSILWTLLFIVLGIVLWRLTKWGCKPHEVERLIKNWDGEIVKKTELQVPIEDSPLIIVFILLTVVEVILGLNVLVFEIKTILAALIFPEKIILEYLQAFM